MGNNLLQGPFILSVPTITLPRRTSPEVKVIVCLSGSTDTTRALNRILAPSAVALRCSNRCRPSCYIERVCSAWRWNWAEVALNEPEGMGEYMLPKGGGVVQ